MPPSSNKSKADTATTSPASTAQVMARYFTAAGINHIFGLPGGQNIEFMEAARKEGMEFVLARREGTAALMADAAGQLTGVPGVCMATLGPGATNLVNGVANAYLDRSPVIAVSGQLVRSSALTSVSGPYSWLPRLVWDPPSLARRPV